MIAVGSLPEKLPHSDPEELRVAAKRIGGLATYVRNQGRSVTATTGGVAAGSPDWSGTASHAWLALGTAEAEDCAHGATALERMASTLSWLATRLEDAQADLDVARRDLERIELETLVAAAKDALLPGSGRAAALADDRERALAAGRRALEDAERDSRVAAGRFDDIAAGAAQIDDRARPAPGAPNGSGPAPTKAALLVAVLLGSVAHNRMKGAGFERAMLRELGLTKNTQKIAGVTLRGIVGNVIPDGLTSGELLEIKSSRYQANSAQIQRMISRATAARPFVLVVGPKTRLSRPLQAIVRTYPHVVLRRWVGNGVFSDNVDPKKPGTLRRRDAAAQTFNRVPPAQQTVAGRPGGAAVRGVPSRPGTGSPAPPGSRPSAPRIRIPFGR